MKICNTCSTIPLSSKIYKAKYDNKIEDNLPKSNKRFHKQNTIKIKVEKLRPNTVIFYFATQTRDFTKPVISRDTAYGSLKNSGVTKSNMLGEAYFYLKCPQIYYLPNKKIYSRHFHFLYWSNNQWEKQIYTHKIFCDVNKLFVKKHINNKNVVIIDALPKESFDKNCIKGAINVPYDQKINKIKLINDIKHKIKKDVVPLSIPIIIYCLDKNCEASGIVKERLDTLGFYNTLHYIGGIKDWVKK
jgi:rhodanese-related sulfurtransferase